MIINTIQLQADLTSFFIAYIYKQEGSNCDDEKEMMDRYLHDSILNEKVKELVKGSMEIAIRYADKAA